MASFIFLVVLREILFIYNNIYSKWINITYCTHRNIHRLVVNYISNKYTHTHTYIERREGYILTDTHIIDLDPFCQKIESNIAE